MKNKLQKSWDKGGKRKSFWTLARKVTNAVQSDPVIEGLIKDGVSYFDLPSRSKIAAEYLASLFANLPKPKDYGLLPRPVDVFTTSDLITAWESHNSNKAVGPDLLDMSTITTR
jgi:hypothetical protein